MQQTEYVDSLSPEVIESSAPLAPLVAPQPEQQSNEQWQRVNAQVSTFLAELPNYIGRFFNEYKQPLIVIGLILASIVALRAVLAVVDVFNHIPLLAPTFQIIGLGYTAWFVNRYLLRASNRQELSQELQKLKEQVVGSQQ